MKPRRSLSPTKPSPAFDRRISMPASILRRRDSEERKPSRRVSFASKARMRFLPPLDKKDESSESEAPWPSWNQNDGFFGEDSVASAAEDTPKVTPEKKNEHSSDYESSFEVPVNTEQRKDDTTYSLDSVDSMNSPLGAKSRSSSSSRNIPGPLGSRMQQEMSKEQAEAFLELLKAEKSINSPYSSPTPRPKIPSTPPSAFKGASIARTPPFKSPEKISQVMFSPIRTPEKQIRKVDPQTPISSRINRILGSQYVRQESPKDVTLTFGNTVNDYEDLQKLVFPESRIGFEIENFEQLLRHCGLYFDTKRIVPVIELKPSANPCREITASLAMWPQISVMHQMAQQMWGEIATASNLAQSAMKSEPKIIHQLNSSRGNPGLHAFLIDRVRNLSSACEMSVIMQLLNDEQPRFEELLETLKFNKKILQEDNKRFESFFEDWKTEVIRTCAEVEDFDKKILENINKKKQHRDKQLKQLETVKNQNDEMEQKITESDEQIKLKEERIAFLKQNIDKNTKKLEKISKSNQSLVENAKKFQFVTRADYEKMEREQHFLSQLLGWNIKHCLVAQEQPEHSSKYKGLYPYIYKDSLKVFVKMEDGNFMIKFIEAPLGLHEIVYNLVSQYEERMPMNSLPEAMMWIARKWDWLSVFQKNLQQVEKKFRATLDLNEELTITVKYFKMKKYRINVSIHINPWHPDSFEFSIRSAYGLAPILLINKAMVGVESHDVLEIFSRVLCVIRDANLH